jgi:hypothetical protein
MVSRMEILKEYPVIDENYKPSITMSYMDYFNRAMVFAQTNYQDQLSKLANTHFHRMTPTFFFEEYAWTVCAMGINVKTASLYFTSMSKHLQPYYRAFWDLNYLPKEEDMKDKLIPFIHNEAKCNALWKTARIINNGVRLFGWDKYRNNFLDESNKLQALPFIGSSNCIQLARNIGLQRPGISGTHLHRMAVRWGFQHPDDLCLAISKQVVLQTKVIGQILWYAGTTFGTNIP